MARVYQLSHDTFYRDGYEVDELPSDHDAWLIDPDSINERPKLQDWWEPKPLTVPQGVAFEGIGIFLIGSSASEGYSTDYPLIKQNWPILSQRSIDSLRSVGEFPHQAFPVVIYDTSVVETESPNRNYVALQLLSHLDIIDWENSIYEVGEFYTSFRSIALHEPEFGFPPIFRVKHKSASLFVSSAARDALQAAGIRGMSFRPL